MRIAYFTDTNLRTQLAANALKSVYSRDWERISSGLVNVYSQVIEEEQVRNMPLSA